MIKLLLSVSHPLAVTAFLYLGAGAGILMLFLLTSFRDTVKNISFSLKGCPGLLAGTVLTGGIIAPVIQFSALSVTPAAMAALLLNFEIIATAAFAWGIFHERVTKNLLLAIVLVLLGSLVLSFDTGSVWGFSIGAAGILFSCIFWGLDNNLMGRVPVDNPSTIVIIKGLIGGGVLFLAIPFFHVSLPRSGSDPDHIDYRIFYLWFRSCPSDRIVAFAGCGEDRSIFRNRSVHRSLRPPWSCSARHPVCKFLYRYPFYGGHNCPASAAESRILTLYTGRASNTTTYQVP